MNFLKRNMNAILICLLEVLIGILLLVNPLGFTSVIIIVLGVVLLVGGVLSVIEYFRTEPVEASFRGALARGLALILAGGFLVIRPTWLIATFPVFTMIYGVVILIGGLYKVQWFADALRMKTGKWLFHALTAVVSIVCAVIILANPFATTVALCMFIGISLIVEAILDVIAMIFDRGRNEEQ